MIELLFYWVLIVLSAVIVLPLVIYQCTKMGVAAYFQVRRRFNNQEKGKPDANKGTQKTT